MPLHQYDPADTTLRQAATAQEQVHTVTTVTTDRTIEIPLPASTALEEDLSRVRKVDYGFAIA